MISQSNRHYCIRCSTYRHTRCLQIPELLPLLVHPQLPTQTATTSTTTKPSFGKANPTMRTSHTRKKKEDLFKAQHQMQPQKYILDIFREYQYPYQPQLPKEIDYHINNYSHNQQRTHIFQNKHHKHFLLLTNSIVYS